MYDARRIAVNIACAGNLFDCHCDEQRPVNEIVSVSGDEPHAG
jgi:hypothetical protein